MDVHEEMYQAAMSSAAAGAGDETDLYDDALRTRPLSETSSFLGSLLHHHHHPQHEGDWAGYDRKNNVGFVVGIFCIGLFQFQGKNGILYVAWWN